MNLSKVVNILTQAENELMRQIGLNERHYDSLQELMGLAQQISGIADEISNYIDDEDEEEDWYKEARQGADGASECDAEEWMR